MPENKLNLLADFPSVSTEQWMEVVTADLKGADFDRKLLWKTNEGFNVKPFYRAEDIQGLSTTEATPGKFPYVRGAKADNNWLVRQDIIVKDAAKANAKAKDLMTKGVNAFYFTIDRDDLNAAFIATLLADIPAN